MQGDLKFVPLKEFVYYEKVEEMAKMEVVSGGVLGKYIFEA